MKPKIVKCNEKRLYYCRGGQIPFKAEVMLIGKIYFPTAPWRLLYELKA